ncbi:hypothetical protein LINPERHAP1_LOCUS14841 [Linum perenne]
MFVGIRSFLYGESIGGAMCLLIHFANPNSFNGVGKDFSTEFSFFFGFHDKSRVLTGMRWRIVLMPMCRIADEIKPKWPIPETLTFVAKFRLTLAIVLSGDVPRSSVKLEDKLEVAETRRVEELGEGGGQA